jgi:hypothetical protein
MRGYRVFGRIGAGENKEADGVVKGCRWEGFTMGAVAAGLVVAFQEGR